MVSERSTLPVSRPPSGTTAGPEQGAAWGAAWGSLFHHLAPYALLFLVLAALAGGYSVVVGQELPQLQWARRGALGLLVLVPVMAMFEFHLRRGRAPTMLFSRNVDLRGAGRGLSHHLAHLPAVLRLGAVGLFVLALARPQRETPLAAEVEGIDIVIAFDVSNSMSERDLVPDRLSAAKEVLRNFIQRRRSDRVGLVIFGRDAFTQCPLTLDYRALVHLLDDVRLGLIDGRGTAIGNAIGTALNRLRKSDSKSRVVILLTDGDNNAGNLSPEQAARYAQALGVKIFTILMGRDVDDVGQPGLLRPAPRYPVNPKLLERIAQQTGGTPYLATDTPALEKRFQAILDELDRSRFKEQRGRKDEMQLWFSAPALGLLLASIALGLTRFRRFP